MDYALAATADPLVGSLVDDRYRVLQQIASGGMASVYMARDERLGRTVAVKIMHESYAADDRFAERFVREARAIAALSHLNVVAVFDQGVHAGRAYLVMEHVAGTTLRMILSERGRLSPAEAMDLLEPVLEALAAAHRAGLVHRDVKPENVLVGHDGSVKVADFGLARGAAAITDTAGSGMLMGTVAYVAPEQVTAGSADPCSDVYGAGIMFFEMLTGQVPYSGSAVEVVQQHVHLDVPPPSSVAPDVPVALDRLVIAATRRRAMERLADGAAFLTGLRHVRQLLDLPRGEFYPGGGETATATVPISSTPLPASGMPASGMPAPASGGPLAGGYPVQPAPSTRVFSGSAAPVPPRTEHYADSVPAEPPSRRQHGGGHGSTLFTRRRIAVLAGIIAVMLLAVTAGGLGWYLSKPDYVTAPTLTELRRAEAERIAAATEITVSYGQAEFSETAPKDTVLKQDPEAGRRMRKGDQVTLVLSKGQERIAVPTVVNAQQNDAEAALRAAGLTPKVDPVTRFSDTVPEGAVVSTDPSAGTRVKPGSTITLVISKGQKAVAQDVAGKTLDEARSILEKDGYKVEINEVPSNDVPAGTVVSQEPGPGELEKGSSVLLNVSKGPDKVVVPELRNQTVDEARQALEASGLALGEVEDFPFGADRVIRSDPGAGSEVPPGTAVKIYTF